MSKELNYLTIALSLAAMGLIASKYWPAQRMPPGYTLQTDGYNWRFIALENDCYFTNYVNDGTRLGTIKEAWKIHRANQHEWRDVK